MVLEEDCWPNELNVWLWWDLWRELLMRGGRAGPLLGRELYAEKAERDLVERKKECNKLFSSPEPPVPISRRTLGSRKGQFDWLSSLSPIFNNSTLGKHPLVRLQHLQARFSWSQLKRAAKFWTEVTFTCFTVENFTQNSRRKPVLNFLKVCRCYTIERFDLKINQWRFLEKKKPGDELLTT